MPSAIRRLHRATVRWVADTFTLSARSANWRGRTRDHIAAHHHWHHRPLQHHLPRRTRLLGRWQARIERILTLATARGKRS